MIFSPVKSIYKYPMHTIALYICDPKCSVQSGNGIMQALGSHFKFKIFGRNRLEDCFFDDVDMIAVPGGFGDADSYSSVMKHNQDRIRKFVTDGGRYLGICMGAYWAGSNYLDILKSVDAVQYIRRPGTDTHRPHAKALAVTWKSHPERMFFYDGCALIGPGRKTVVSTYANGDAMAIYQDRIGLIGCHPESERFWYEAYRYTLPHWHERRHHELLLEFADELMKR
jgi:hypothetical protein